MSGATIGGLLGGVVGFFVGGPVGAQIGFALGSYAGSSFDSYHTPGPRLGDLPVQTSQEGMPRPIVYGTPQPFMCNIIQSGPKNRFIVKEEVDQGGKGGPTYTTDREEVTQTFALRICEGNANLKLLRLWADGKLFYDAFGGALEADSVTAATKFRFYAGGEDQEPDPSLESLPAENGGGVGNVPAYRGTSYIVFDNFNLTAYGGRIPQIQVQVSSNATVTQSCAEGLLAWWPLDDAVPGGRAREVISGYDGIYTNNVSPFVCTVESRAPLNLTGNASTWFGANDSMLVEDAEALGFEANESWSVSVWYSIDDDHTAAIKVLGIGYVAEDGRSVWGNHLNNASGSGEFLTPAGGYNNGTDHYVEADFDVSTNTAYYQVTTYDVDTNTLSLYLNGSLIGSITPSGNGGAVDFVAVGSGLGGLRGQAQDLMLWGRPLSATEIRNSYAVGPGVYEIPDAPGTYMRYDGTVVAPCALSATVDTIPLSEIVADISDRVGVSAAQRDLTADDAVPVEGFLIGRQLTGQGALQTLANAYFRYYPEYDLKIRSVPCGQSTVATLTDDDFIESNEDERTVRQSIELPRRWLLAYSDKDVNYARRIQQAERESQNVASTGNSEIEFPLVFNADQAAQKVEIVAKVVTESALGGTIKRKLPAYKWAQLVASDRIEYDSKEWCIKRLDWLDGLIDFEADRDRASNYISSTVGGVALDPTAPVSSTKGPSILLALNLPRLTSAENKPGMYLAVTGLTQAWPGADIYLSTDGGATEVKVATITRRATMGYLLADIDQDDEPISVLIFNERNLATVTAEQLAARANGFAITTNDVSEVGQFQTAVESASSEWDLTDVTRGQLDTDAASHSADDSFLLLDEALAFVPIDISFAGQTLIFRAVTRGTPRENNDTISVLFDPQFTGPADIEYLLDEAGNTLLDEADAVLLEG